MKWFGRQNKVVEVPPELQPYYEGPTGQAATWWQWGRWLVAAVVLIGLGLAIYFWGPWAPSGNKPATTSSIPGSHGTTGPNQGQVKTPPANNQGGSASSNSAKGTNKPSGNAKSAPAPSSGAPTQNPTQSDNRQLTNTGPGDTVALFAAVVLLGGGAYELYLRRHVAQK